MGDQFSHLSLAVNVITDVIGLVSKSLRHLDKQTEMTVRKVVLPTTRQGDSFQFPGCGLQMRVGVRVQPARFIFRVPARH